MKKKALILLVIGSLYVSLTLFTKHLFSGFNGIDDFAKGLLGVALIISALFVQRKLERNPNNVKNKL
ncbi:MAG: hypothetical protein IPL55_19250 [Saprospiraceae bacterium]|jgi:hypothetical protein|nr:hypothetical protein [Saprospiraceae bacterium]